MKRLTLGVCCLALVALCACGGGSKKDLKPTAMGKPFEVVASMPDVLWRGEVGDTLRAILEEELPLLNQSEPLVDLVYIAPGALTGITAKHRNILTIEVSQTKFSEPAMNAEYDVTARPQILVRITGPSDSAVVAYMDQNREALQKIFEITERNRFVSLARTASSESINREIKELLGIDVTIPRGYKTREIGKDYIWISYEMPLVSQGFLIYTYPFDGRNDFSIESLIDRRDQFVKNIPGPSGTSYMTTYTEMGPERTSFRIDGRLWFELRGFWELGGGDFMGGPFVNYTTIDATNRRMIAIDGYVYSPKNAKRNYLRQLESMVFTVKLPGDTTSTLRLEADTIPAVPVVR